MFMYRFRNFLEKQWFIFSLVVFFFGSIANATNTYLKLPRFSKIQEHCEDRDAEIMGALMATIGDCQFSRVEVNFPTEMHYLACTKFQIEKFIKIQSKECRDFLVPFIRDTLHQNLKQKIENSTLDPNPDNKTKDQLISAFKVFNYWAIQTEKTIYSVKPGYASFENPEAIYEQDIHQALYSYWKKVWQFTQSTQTLMQADQNYSRGIELLTQTLEIVNELKLKPQVAFPLIEQILAHFERRVTLFTQLAQFSCELLNCDTLSGRNAEIFQINQSLAELAQKNPSLDVMQMSVERVTDEKLKSFLLNFVKAAHDYQEHLFTEQEDKYSIYELQEKRIPKASQGYLTLLRMLANQAQTFLNRVQGQSHFIPTLEIGLTPTNIEGLPQKVSRLRSSLENSLVEFRALQNRVAQQQTQQNQNQVQQLQLEEQLRSEEENLKNLLHDRDGLQAKLMDEESIKNQRTRSFFQILNSENWQRNHAQHLIQVAEGRLNIAGMGRLDPNKKRYQSLRQLEVPNTTIRVKAGEVVQFLVSGSWTPSCAIEKEGYPIGSITGPEGYTLQENHGRIEAHSVSTSLSHRSFDLTQNTIGKETREFNRRSETESSQTIDSTQSSVTDSTTNTQGDRTSHSDAFVDDQRVSTSASIGVSFIVSASQSVSRTEAGKVITDTKETYSATEKAHTESQTHSKTSQYMTSTDVSQGVEESKTSSEQASKGKETSAINQSQIDKTEETRSSASFALGLRSPLTPYPNLPAGALILVQTKGNQIIDREVIRPNTVKLIHENSELHFVVNDCRGSIVPQEDNHLVLQYQVQESSDTRLRRLIHHLHRIMEEIYHTSDAFLASGDLTPIQVKELEGRARAEISKIGYDLRDFPLFQDLFEFWLVNAINQIELRVKILQAERKITPSVRQLNLIQSELENIKNQIGISYLTQVWNLDNFDLMNLGQSLRHVALDLQSQVVPIIQIRFPEVIEQLGYEHGRFMDALHLGSSLEELNQRFQAVLRSLEQYLEASRAKSNFLDATIVMRFPRNRETACNPEEGICPIANLLTSEGVWSAFDHAKIPLEHLETPELRLQNALNSIATIPVLPEEVYVREGVKDPLTGLFSRRPVLSGSLRNTATAPIVQSMALYFKMEDLEDTATQLNEAQLEAQTQLVSESCFPLKNKGHCQKYYVPANWSDISLPLFLGDSQSPVTLFDKLGLNQKAAGVGISPFSHFRIDFRQFNLDKGTLAECVPQIKEMMLVFKVNYINSDLNLPAQIRSK